MNLKGISKAELARISRTARVESYHLGFATNGTAVLLKLRFEGGRVELYWLPSIVAAHFAKANRRAQRVNKWPRTENWPSNPPEITADDWDFAKNKNGWTSQYRAEPFSDALVIALQVGSDLFQVIRLSPEHAVQIGEMIWEQMQNNNLRDIATETPKTPSRH